MLEQFEERWVKTGAFLLERFGKKPDMEGILFLIGINELGMLPDKNFSKEQKQDLMHVAVCTLLCRRGYFRFAGRDDDGWPHFEALESTSPTGMKNQETLLKECIIEYFEQ